MNFFVLFLALCSAASSSYNYDRPCGRTASELWLDVVILVDVSQNMTNENLERVTSNILTTFSAKTRIGENQPSPKNTRIGIVTYSNTATTVATLDQFQSFNDLFQHFVNHPLNVYSPESNLYLGLNKAQELLTAGRSNNKRANYQQVIILYIGTVQAVGSSDALAVAQNIKSSGINIILMSFVNSNDAGTDQFLGNLATPGMRWRGFQYSSFAAIHYSMIANCYCQPPWQIYTPDSSTRMGLCLQVVMEPTSWSVAKLACQNIGGYLVTEFDNSKRNFIRNITGGEGHHIGLNYVNGGWNWQQPNGQPLVPLTTTNRQDGVFWNPGYPVGMSVNTGVASVIGSNGVIGWQNINPYTDNKIYICEKYSCDTDYYCS